MNKNQIFLKKFKSNFATFLNDKRVLSFTSNHFDKDQSFITFMLALCSNQLSSQETAILLNNNFDSFIDVFKQLYCNNNITNELKKVLDNPIVDISELRKDYLCFLPFIDAFIDLIKKLNVDLKIGASNLKTLILNGLSYLAYNKINLKVPFKLNEIIIDKNYDKKLVFIENNVSFFSSFKQSVIDCCNKKINDFIVIVLALSNELSKQK